MYVSFSPDVFTYDLMNSNSANGCSLVAIPDQNRITMVAYSAGSTTDLTVKVGSFAGFIEGKKQLLVAFVIALPEEVQTRVLTVAPTIRYLFQCDAFLQQTRQIGRA